MEIQDIDLKELIETETGEKFNKQGYVKCPFHMEKTPSLRVKFNPDTNKDFFKCFGCSECGDAIDFIMKYKNIDYIAAKEYLGLEVQKTEKELQEEKVKSYIDWELSKFRQGQKLLGVFKFVNDKNEIAYFKAKFVNEEGKKQLSYYHLENDKVIAKRGTDEVPYNLYNVLKAIENNRVLIVVEGEKDANTINSIFKNKEYVATSFKACKDLEILKKHRLRIYVIGDTGQAGEQYKWNVCKEFKKYSKEFKFINLPGLKSLGDNKDVTDWIEVGHNKKDLITAFNRSLDLKNKYELQQDAGGIYKIIFKEKADEILEREKYITDFRLIEATRIEFVEEEEEGIKLKFKSITGNIIERTGKSTAFDDVKSFKHFLGSMDLVFDGRIEDLNKLKGWINRFFATENQEIYLGVKFIEKNEKLIFIENEGSISKDGIDINIKSDGQNNANMLQVNPIEKDELKELIKHIFKFAAPEKSISIIGTVINNLAVHQCQQLKQKLHHLLIVGESGSGKSTIIENIIAPLLNYPLNDKESIGQAKPFGILKALSIGNYPMIYEEFKPSTFDRYKIANISDVLRNLYDRSTVSRGNKSLKTTKFNLCRPVIIAGEESYPNQEKALIERSCIVYLSKRERTKKSTEAVEWLIKNEEVLNKLGRSLIEIILEMSVEEYKKLREIAKEDIKTLKNRTQTTAVNISCGMMILNKLLEKHGLKQLDNFQEHIIKNIKEEVLEGAGDTHSIVEKMLILYNNMIEDGRALNSEDVVKYRGDGLFIKTSEMINQIYEHVTRFGSDLIPLKLKDFKKQAKKAGYIKDFSNKLIKVEKKVVRFDTYDVDRLRKLNVPLIVPPELEEVVDEKEKIIPFDLGNGK